MSRPGLSSLSPTQVTAFWSRVDCTGDCWIWQGAVSGAGYGRLNAKGTSVYAHRVALEMSGVQVPADLDVDHVCHTRRCVRPDHLRIATRSENNQNFGGAHSHGRSGVRGVSWHSKSKKWRVTVVHEGRQHHGGFHESLHDARRAAIAIRNDLYTHNENDQREKESA